MKIYYLEATACSSQRPCDPEAWSRFEQSAKTKNNKEEEEIAQFDNIYDETRVRLKRNKDKS